MDEVNSKIEPLVIHVRPGAHANNLQQDIVSKLSQEHGFINLDVNQCIKGESQRCTLVGQEFNKYVKAAKVIPAEMIVRMLNKVIYCGQIEADKFILSNFPDVID